MLREVGKVPSRVGPGVVDYRFPQLRVEGISPPRTASAGVVNHTPGVVIHTQTVGDTFSIRTRVHLFLS